jgi:creatinine amidohydrolase/Fe(II)-dependent formamide hydrolase-like protein
LPRDRPTLRSLAALGGPHCRRGAERWRYAARHGARSGPASYTKSGVIGTPSLGTAAKGKALIRSLVSAFGRHLEDTGLSQPG